MGQQTPAAATAEPGATRMKADLWLPVALRCAHGSAWTPDTRMAPLVPRRRRWSNSRGQWLAPLVTGRNPELQRAELAEAQVPAEAACRVIIILRDLQGVCSSVADFSGDSRFCPTTTTRSSTRIRGSKS